MNQIPVPQTVQEALGDENWRKATSKEMLALEKKKQNVGGHGVIKRETTNGV